MVAMPAEAPVLPAATPRFDTIDVLRGYSILAVVLLHTWLRLYLSGYDLRRPSIPHMVMRLLFFNGGNGVTVFFAISGFLITLTSLRRFGSLPAMRVGTFYRIRFARIAPTLFLLVAILSGLAMLHAEGFQFTSRMPPLWRAVVSAFTFHLNWLEARFGYLPANWDVLWSLSVEETFYLLFPLVCVAVLRFRHGMIVFLAILGALVVMGPFARATWSTNDIWLEKSYLGGMDGIALGCLTALLTRHLESRPTAMNSQSYQRVLGAVQVAGWVIVAVTALGPKWFWELLPSTPDCYGTLLAVAACMVMLGSVLRQAGSLSRTASRVSAPLRWYGRHSYEIYLTHEFAVVWGVQLFLHFHPASDTHPHAPAPQQPALAGMLLWVLVILLATIPLGWATARFFSEPMNRFFRGARPPRSLEQVAAQPESVRTAPLT